jgi:DnaK suppressor protein
MNKELIAAIEKQLLAERDQLLADINKTISGLNQYQHKDEFVDFTDQSSMESDRSFHLHMKERDRNLLIKIERTLEKIKDGSFGICEECSGEIGEKRLLARPVVTLCIECKTKQEQEEKLSNNR